MGFFNWSILLPLLPLIPILVGLYFLKMKRPVREIPSILLWQKVLEDEKVNSPFQRFKNNILLFIQLLLLLIMIMAAMQPFWRNHEIGVQRQIIAIDTSASMGRILNSSQTGQEEARTNFDLAIEQVEKIINRLEKDQQIALVSFNNVAQQHVGYTSDQRKLKRALKEVKLKHVEGDLKPALELLSGLAKSAPIDRVHLISDGNFEAETEFDLPFKVRYTPPSGTLDADEIPGNMEMINVGIIHFSAQLEPDGSATLLARLAASRRSEGAKTLISAKVTLSEIEDGKAEILKSQTTNWTEGENISLMFEVPSLAQDSERVFALSIEPQQPDSLSSDNDAYVTMGHARPLTLSFKTSQDPASFKAFFRKAPELEIMEATEASQASILLQPPEHSADEISPLASTLGTVIHSNQLPTDLTDLISLKSTENAVPIIDWRRDDPLLRYVDLREIIVMDQSTWRLSDSIPTVIEAAGELALRGYESLIEGPQGPLLLKRSVEGQWHYYFLFDPDRSTMPYQLALPLLLTNVLNQQRLRDGGSSRSAEKTGTLAYRNEKIVSGETYSIRSPDLKSEQRLTSDVSGELSGISANAPGRYLIKSSGGESFSIYASLISEQETKLNSIRQIKFNDQQVVTATAAEIPGNQPLWHWIVSIGLAILFIEWWFYNTPAARRLNFWKVNRPN